MVEGKQVAVVMPAYNEEKLLETTVAAIPPFVDRVYVVDDASRDATVGRAHTAAAADARITVIVHERNHGAGAAVVTGYKRALEDGAEVVCVMNADNQMDPAEMESLVMPVVNGEVDYTKANRLFTGEAWNLIPHYRYLGNAMLSLLTKIASGLLARRGLAGRLHRDQPPHAGAPRSRQHLSALRLPERHARPPQRMVGARS